MLQSYSCLIFLDRHLLNEIFNNFGSITEIFIVLHIIYEKPQNNKSEYFFKILYHELNFFITSPKTCSREGN